MRGIQPLAIWVCSMFLATGCVVPEQKRFVDVSTRNFSPAARVTARGDTLRIFIQENIKELAVAEISPQVIEGNIYLFTRYMSHVRRNAEFVFDMSDKRFPRDWKKRLYWNEYDAIPSPLFPFATDRVNELHRRKITVNLEI